MYMYMGAPRKKHGVPNTDPHIIGSLLQGLLNRAPNDWKQIPSPTTIQNQAYGWVLGLTGSRQLRALRALFGV